MLALKSGLTALACFASKTNRAYAFALGTKKEFYLQSTIPTHVVSIAVSDASAFQLGMGAILNVSFVCPSGCSRAQTCGSRERVVDTSIHARPEQSGYAVHSSSHTHTFSFPHSPCPLQWFGHAAIAFTTRSAATIHRENVIARRISHSARRAKWLQNKGSSVRFEPAARA